MISSYSEMYKNDFLLCCRLYLVYFVILATNARLGHSVDFTQMTSSEKVSLTQRPKWPGWSLANHVRRAYRSVRFHWLPQDDVSAYSEIYKLEILVTKIYLNTWPVSYINRYFAQFQRVFQSFSLSSKGKINYRKTYQKGFFGKTSPLCLFRDVPCSV